MCLFIIIIIIIINTMLKAYFYCIDVEPVGKWTSVRPI